MKYYTKYDMTEIKQMLPYELVLYKAFFIDERRRENENNG